MFQAGAAGGQCAFCWDWVECFAFNICKPDDEPGSHLQLHLPLQMGKLRDIQDHAQSCTAWES